MADATATSAVKGFSAALNRMPAELKKRLTYDQGREMTRHAEITQKTGTAIYFCDPHSPWQRGSKLQSYINSSRMSLVFPAQRYLTMKQLHIVRSS